MALMNSHKNWQFESADDAYDTSEQTKKGRILPENIKQERLNRNLARKIDKADPQARKSLPAATADSDLLGDMVKGGTAGGMVGGGLGAGTLLVAGQLGPQALTPEEIVTVPAAASIGSTIGAGVGATAAGAKNILERFLNKKKKEGVPANADIGGAVGPQPGAFIPPEKSTQEILKGDSPEEMLNRAAELKSKSHPEYRRYNQVRPQLVSRAQRLSVNQATESIPKI